MSPYLDSIPRRVRRDKMTPMELELSDVAQKIEGLGCSPILTDALNHVHKARHCVADFVDGLPHTDRPVESAWLIERPSASSTVYFAYECSTGAWSFGWSNAIRFSREEDAKRMITILKQLKPEFMEGAVARCHQWG